MLHEPAAKAGPDPAFAFKKRLGAINFVIYALTYVGFVVINLAYPSLMEKTIVAGLNLAVAYGFGLILFALVLALIYNHRCGKQEAKLRETGEGRV
jgi:uncharacterized membrane protein (DUF485 family)